VYVAENLWGGDSYYNGRVRIFLVLTNFVALA